MFESIHNTSLLFGRISRSVRRYCSAACLLLAVGVPALCHAGDIWEIEIGTNLSYAAGVLEPFPYSFEIWLNGDLADIASIAVSTPPGSAVPSIALVKDIANGSWGWESPLGYSDLTALQTDYSTGDYVFSFYDAGAVLVDTVTLNYAPVLPTGFAAVSSPLPGGILPYLSPLFSWDDASAFGSFLQMHIDDVTGENKIYESFLTIDTLSWSPGSLTSGSDYWFNLWHDVTT